MLKNIFKGQHGSKSYLEQACGIIHIGGHMAQERDQYAEHGLDVVWVEPNPALFNVLASNIEDYSQQRAIQELVGPEDGEEVDFHVSDNNGASSSILKPKFHLEMHPEVKFDQTIKMKTMTLPTIMREYGIDPAGFDALLLDTQGTELSIVRGAESILKGFRWVKLEVADFEAYQGCATRSEMVSYFKARGYKLVESERIARRKGIGSYYDLTFERS
ncbi:MAG: FkbM family methyltransferase [Phycisphaerales bacterium]|nr:FkbM family methyltransferase [Phycisphaerales bacterium]